MKTIITEFKTHEEAVAWAEKAGFTVIMVSNSLEHEFIELMVI